MTLTETFRTPYWRDPHPGPAVGDYLLRPGPSAWRILEVSHDGTDWVLECERVFEWHPWRNDSNRGARVFEWSWRTTRPAA